VTTWTEKDGLPSSQVRAIVQTGDGFLWLATSAGVVRFDGVTFTSDIAGVPDGDVSVICAARDGGLWIAFDRRSYGALLNGRVDSFGPDPTVSGSLFTQMVEDTSGNVWVGGRSGLFRFTRGRWRRMTRDDGFTAVTVTSLYVDSRGRAPGRIDRAWCADHETRGGPFRIDSVEFAHTRIGEDAAGAIWVADHVRAFRLLRGTPASPLPTVGSEPSYGYRVVHDRAGALWVATQGDG
jgi:ligand-binding sensor domain-containing protein